MEKVLTAALLALSLVFAPLRDARLPDGDEGNTPRIHVCGGEVFDAPLSGDLSRKLESGNYFLTGDCRLLNRVMITGEVSICLNGYRIDAHNATTLQVCRDGVLSIYDCSGEGLVGFVGGPDHNHPVTVDAGGTFNLYGGWLYARNGSNAVNSKGTVNIFGGLVESRDPGFCAVRNESVLSLYGGVLRGHTGVSQRGSAKMFICGDTLVIDSAVNAVQYVSAERPLIVETPSYLWRTEPEGTFVSAPEQPFAYRDKTAYLEFVPAEPSAVPPGS